MIAIVLAALSIARTGAQEERPRGARELVEALGADRVEDREEAERGLKKLGSAAVAELERAAKSSDPEVAWRAGRALRAIEARRRLTPAILEAMPGIEDRLAEGLDPAWTRAFLEANAGHDRGSPAFKDEDIDSLAGPAVRGAQGRDEKWAVCRVAARRRCLSAVPELIRMLEDPEGCVNAIQALRSLGAREAIPSIIGLLDHEDVLTVRHALEALGDLKAAEAFPRIVPLARHGDGYMRLDAVKALKETGGAEAVTHLISMVEDPEPFVRCAAMAALGALGACEAVSVIAGRLEDERMDVRREAVAALRALDARGAAPQVARLVRDGDQGVSTLSAETLVRWRAREAAPVLVEALDDADARVREAALAALAGTGAADSMPAVVRRLGSPDAATRAAALRVLGWWGSKKALPEISAALRDADASVRAAAAAALGDMGAREAVKDVIPLLDDPDWHVRVRLSEFLGNHGTAEAAGRLRRLLQDDRGEVRRAAAEAMCALGSPEGVPVLLEQAGLSRSASLFALNALRRRDAWRRLRDVSLKDLSGGVTTVEVVRTISGKSALAIDPGAIAGDGRGDRIFCWFPPWDGPADGASAVCRMAAEASLEVVLESDRIRLLAVGEALAFWKEWWEEKVRER